MKELILDLRDSFVALFREFCRFIWNILSIIMYTFCLLYRLLIRPYHLSVWYKYHFTQYYQKHINEFTIQRIFRFIESDRRSLYVKNERMWACKIIRRYRQSK